MSSCESKKTIITGSIITLKYYVIHCMGEAPSASKREIRTHSTSHGSDFKKYLEGTVRSPFPL